MSARPNLLDEVMPSYDVHVTRQAQARIRFAIVISSILAASGPAMAASEFAAGPRQLSAQNEDSRRLPKGKRILAIKANMGEGGDFDAIFHEALEAGSEAQVLPQDWNELETAPGKFEPRANYLAIANSYYPLRKTPIHLAIRPIHTNPGSATEGPCASTNGGAFVSSGKRSSCSATTFRPT